MAKGFNRAVLLALLVALPAAILSGSAAASSATLVRVGATPRVPTGAQSLGAVSSSASLSGTVVLKPRDNAALVQFIAAVSDPSSPMFHQYLRPARSRAGSVRPRRRSPPCARSWRRTACTSTASRAMGCWSTSRAPPRRSSTPSRPGSSATGCPAAALAQTTTSAAAVPSAIAGSVAGVVGLNDLARAQPADIRRPRGSDRAKIRPALTTTFTSSGRLADAVRRRDRRCPDARRADRRPDRLRVRRLRPVRQRGPRRRPAHRASTSSSRSPTPTCKTFDTCYFGALGGRPCSAALNVIPIDGGQPVGPGQRRGEPRRRGHLGDRAGRHDRRLRGAESGSERDRSTTRSTTTPR